MKRIHPPRQRDLLKREARRLLFARRHESRPELRGDLAFPQPRYVGVAAIAPLFEMKRCDVAPRVLVGTDDEGQIVMAVEKRDALQERPSAVEHAHANSMIGAST